METVTGVLQEQAQTLVASRERDDMVIKSIIHALYSPSAITCLVGPGGIGSVHGNMPVRTPVLLAKFYGYFHL